MERWLDEECPRIAARAEFEQAEIFWVDVAGLHSDGFRSRGYVPKGHTPVVRIKNKREGLRIISTVPNPSKVLWKTFEDAMRAEWF